MEMTGVKSAGLAGASFFNKPGRKKLAGETLCLALTPPQPATASGNTASRAKREKLQFNLTCRL